MFNEEIKHLSWVSGWDRKSVPRITALHHEASPVITNGDTKGLIFLSHPHTNNWFFFLLTIDFLFSIIFTSLWICWDPRSHDDVILIKQWRHLTTMCASSNTINEQSSRESLGKITWVRWEFLTQAKTSDIHVLIHWARKYLPFSNYLYSNACLKWPLSKRPQIGFQDQL